MFTLMVPPEISQAIQLFQAGRQDESRQCLHTFLREQPGTIDALLWLARTSSDPQEAVAAADLALMLNPGNEVAQRATIAVRKRENPPCRQPDLEPAELRASVALTTGMTLAQARAMLWPFRGINRPIGEVLDDGTIVLKDLGWAMENARDPRLRDAIRTVLITRLLGAEPKERALPLHVIVGSHYTEWQERSSLGLAALILGGTIVLFVESMLLLVVLNVLKYGYGWDFPWWASFIPLAVMGALFLVMRPTERFFDEAEQHRQGRWGEERAVDALRLALDGSWTLFRNFEWPNRKWGDVDLVLVGPGGSWVLEVKAYSGQIRNVGDRWERRGRRGWRRLTQNPGHQARRNAARLKEYLDNHRVAVRYVEPAVVWAGEPDALDVQDPATPVWTLDDLEEKSDVLWHGRGLSPAAVEQAVKALRGNGANQTEARSPTAIGA